MTKGKIWFNIILMVLLLSMIFIGLGQKCVWIDDDDVTVGSSGYDIWLEMIAPDPPLARVDHTAIWTGNEMIIWGGVITPTAYLDTGARYTLPAETEPDTWPFFTRYPGTWTSTAITDTPTTRAEHTVIWTGNEMIIWGGRNSPVNCLKTGARYYPITDTWMSTDVGGAPSDREWHTAVWTGNEMIIWGGLDGFLNTLDTGAVYTPSINSWTAITTTNAPTTRTFHTAVWTGNEMIIWGGMGPAYDPSDPANVLDSGAKYYLISDTWESVAITDTPSSRLHHTAVWTGSEMIIWGGLDASSTPLTTGGRYNPASDTWTSMTTIGVPSGRAYHTAIWTGSEIIIWGGWDGVNQFFNSGGRYNPSTDTWSPISLACVPSGRRRHQAVWTGSDMIIWGGEEGTDKYVNTGGRYKPP